MLNFTFLKYVVICISLSLLSSCSTPPSALQRVMQRGELVVFTRVDPTTYSLDDSGKQQGFEYELASLFAEQLGVRVTLCFAETVPSHFAIIEQQ
jgi:Predicted soluble lytic transglycosylase fused to an ABC-type amino acid-binding protein